MTTDSTDKDLKQCLCATPTADRLNDVGWICINDNTDPMYAFVAFEAFRRAAEYKTCPFAVHNLGTCLKHGIGCAVDSKRADSRDTPRFMRSKDGKIESVMCPTQTKSVAVDTSGASFTRAMVILSELLLPSEALLVLVRPSSAPKRLILSAAAGGYQFGPELPFASGRLKTNTTWALITNTKAHFGGALTSPDIVIDIPDRYPQVTVFLHLNGSYPQFNAKWILDDIPSSTDEPFIVLTKLF